MVIRKYVCGESGTPIFQKLCFSRERTGNLMAHGALCILRKLHVSPILFAHDLLLFIVMPDRIVHFLFYSAREEFSLHVGVSTLYLCSMGAGAFLVPFHAFFVIQSTLSFFLFACMQTFVKWICMHARMHALCIVVRDACTQATSRQFVRSLIVSRGSSSS